MAHLFEHLTFEGVKGLGKGDFDRLCSLAGGANNAFTTFDRTVYYESLPENQLELALWLESGRIKSFEPSKKILEVQKSVVSEEIRETVYEQPYGRWRELILSKAYEKNSPYAWDIHGSIADVQSVSEEDVAKFKRRYYVPSAAALAIVGNIDFARAEELVEKYFGDIKNENVEPDNIEENKLKFSESGSMEDDVPLAAVFLGFHAPSFKSEKVFALNALADALGAGKSSLLYKRLVYERQIASETGILADIKENDSLLIFYAIASEGSVSAQNLEEALSETIAKEGEMAINPHSLKKAKAAIKSSLARKLSRSKGLAELSAFYYLFKNDPRKIFDLIDIYEKVQLDELRALFERHIEIDKAISARVEPSSES